jgi:hypothetical protein
MERRDFMDDVLLKLASLLVGLAAIFGAFRYAAMVKPDRRSWFAPPPGRLDDPAKGWPSGPANL